MILPYDSFETAFTSFYYTRRAVNVNNVIKISELCYRKNVHLVRSVWSVTDECTGMEIELWFQR